MASKEFNPEVLEVDLLQLELECAHQSRLHQYWSAKLAKARKTLRDAEAELKVVKAELGKAIRSHPARFGLKDKPNKDSVEDEVILQDEYQQQVRVVNEAHYAVDMLFGVVMSLDDRNEQLSNEVKLHGQGYFSTPRTSYEASQSIREVRNREIMTQGQREIE